MNIPTSTVEVCDLEYIIFPYPFFSTDRKLRLGRQRQLAFNKGKYPFRISLEEDGLHELRSPCGHCFVADASSAKKAKKSGTLEKNASIEYFLKSWRDIPTRHEIRESYKDINLTATNRHGDGLRNAQLGAIHSLLAHWTLSCEPATVILPTGTGKTESMLAVTLAERAERVLVIVPSQDLREQISSKFISWGILRDLEIVSDTVLNPIVLTLSHTIKNKDDLESIKESNIVVATPAVLVAAPPEIKAELGKLFSHVFFDEAHHVKANTWDNLKKLFALSKIVQFTATPYRGDRKPIEGKVVYNYPLSKAVEDRCFSKISLITVEERNPARKDHAIAHAAMERLQRDRKNKFTKHRMMVRAGTRAHGLALLNKYREWFPSERITYIDSKTTSRAQLIEKIKNGEFTIIICVDMLKEGFDYPEFKIAAVHGLHKSLAVLLQFIGRFARTRSDLGPASFVVNYAEEEIPKELENLFSEGAGWENVIAEEADRRKSEAESLLNFLQGCKPFSGYESPDVEINPKLVYPALSCTIYNCPKVDWNNFHQAFSMARYGLSQPYFNQESQLFYFSTQRRDAVKWARTKRLRDQIWDLIILHFDEKRKILYVGYTEKTLDLDKLVECLSGEHPDRITKDPVFRSFDSIKRLKIIHAGIFKPANRLNRYSRFSGADVTNELQKWANGKSKKSDFVGIGFRQGQPVGIGASVKGKIWSPARVGDVKEWREWCLSMGKLVFDSSIDPNQLFSESALVTDLSAFQDDLIVLAVDWSEDLYESIHKIEVVDKKAQRLICLLSECVLKLRQIQDTQAEFILSLPSGEETSFLLVLGGENGYKVECDNDQLFVDGMHPVAVSISAFFQDHPPTLFLPDGNTISGCVHTAYKTNLVNIPPTQMEALAWNGVDFTKESMYSSKEGPNPRTNSIQEFVMKKLVAEKADVVFNDDNSGEVADIIAIFVLDEKIRFEFIHCKYSKSSAGSRPADLYEVCGQTFKSLRHKWQPEQLITHILRRNENGVLKGKRFYYGSPAKLAEIKKAMKHSDLEFEFAIAQPGIELAKLGDGARDVLSSTYSSVLEMTEVRLKCYFS